MIGKIILVTGSTDGIGKATARELLTRGHQVILHGRNKEKGRQVISELRNETGRKPRKLLIADLSSQAEIHRLSREITAECPSLNVLINNAGTYQKERRITEDGVEMTFAVNFLAPFLLTFLVMDCLRAGAPSRVVNVASSAHRDIFGVDWDNLQGEKQYDPWAAYALSKFALVASTYQLAGLLRGSRVTANSLHPGVINTKILHTAFPDIRGAPPEWGAKTPVFLAIAPEMEGVSARYYEEMNEVRSEPLTYDPYIQKRLWEIAEGYTGIAFQ